METIYELRRKRNQYYNLKDSLEIIVRNLNDSIDALNVSNQKINESYTIDGVAADNNKISNCKNELIEHRDEILSSVIPAIEQEIRNLRQKIQQAESELTEF